MNSTCVLCALLLAPIALFGMQEPVDQPANSQELAIVIPESPKIKSAPLNRASKDGLPEDLINVACVVGNGVATVAVKGSEFVAQNGPRCCTGLATCCNGLANGLGACCSGICNGTAQCMNGLCYDASLCCNGIANCLNSMGTTVYETGRHYARYPLWPEEEKIIFRRKVKMARDVFIVGGAACGYGSMVWLISNAKKNN